MSSELVEKKTIGEVEHIVHASGLWDGTTAVEFSNDGVEWSPVWAPSDEHPHPVFARVTAYRKDVRLPASPTIRWEEQYPAASEKWSGMWDRSPMRHFGRTVRMIAFRQLFRDILGDIRIEDEADDRDLPTPTGTGVAPRDWEAEIAAAETVEQIDKVEADTRAARVFTPDPAGTALHRALRARRKAIVEAAWALDHTAPSTPEPAAPIERPAPRDYLPPQNRADRRAAARKKGRR